MSRFHDASFHVNIHQSTSFVLPYYLSVQVEFFRFDLVGELLSNLVFEPLNQAAAWLSDSTSIPSLNSTPLITFAR